ncbi:MAG: cadherin-like domain-containing protein, partial [Methylococcales bacterium]|nr:cadherin-like domain-containing protein [Methylococcales bacterium]
MANQNPTGSATGFLTNGTQNTAYTLYEATLVQGFSDPDGDLLNVVGLLANSGAVSELGGGRWNFTPDANFSGVVTFDYFVSDGKGGEIQGALNLNIVSNNHAPTIPTTPINLPVGTANTPYQISKTQLLAGFNDMDGDTLSVTNLTATNGSLTERIDGYTFTPNPNYSGVVSLNYSVTDGKTNGLVAAPVVNFNLNKAFNNPPTGDIKIDGFAKAGVTLTVNSTLSDADGINGAVNYQWFVDNSPVASGYNYTVAATDTGRTITVKGSYTDMLGNPETKMSGNVIVQSAPMYNLSVDKTNVNEGDTVNLTVQSSTNFAQPNEMANLTFSGSVSNTDLNSGYIPTSINLGADGKGQVALSFLKDNLKEGTENLTFTLANDSSKSVTINVNDPVNNPPTGDIKIDGFAKAGVTLTANSTLFDADGINGAVNYQWFVDNSPVASGYNYTVATTDTGKTITVKANYTDFLGNNETIKSNGVIVQAAPTYSLFVDKNNVSEGQTVNLTVQNSTGFAQPNETVNLSFSGNISGADLNNGFIPTSISLGANGQGQISLNFLNDKIKEGTENLTFSLANDTSKSVTINVNDLMNNPPTGNVTITGEAKIGQTLFANTSNIQDLDGLGVMSYQWVSDHTIINGKTPQNYTLDR